MISEGIGLGSNSRRAVPSLCHPAHACRPWYVVCRGWVETSGGLRTFDVSGGAGSEVVGMNGLFQKLAQRTARAAGSSWAFGIALSIVVVWGVTGPVFGFSDTWQLVINTGTTIVTFLMVFLIQNSQNRDTRAIHLKLDEL